MSSADGSSLGAYQWCSHLANASKAVPATVSLPFRPLTVATLVSAGLTYSTGSPISVLNQSCTVVELGVPDRQTDKTDGRMYS